MYFRLSESGLHSYVDLARKVRLFGNSYCCPGASIDESIQRDSATTSAGEDEPHEDTLSRDSGRISNIANQGRTILRRRRQFDSQGTNRIFSFFFFFIINLLCNASENRNPLIIETLL